MFPSISWSTMIYALNVIQSIKILGISNIEKDESIVEDINLKIIRYHYLRQLFRLLTQCSFVKEFSNSFEIEDFDPYAIAIQTLLIPNTLGLDYAYEGDDRSLEEIMESAKTYILVQTKE
jgi:hypothetical protein